MSQLKTKKLIACLLLIWDTEMNNFMQQIRKKIHKKFQGLRLSHPFIQLRSKRNQLYTINTENHTRRLLVFLSLIYRERIFKKYTSVPDTGDYVAIEMVQNEGNFAGDFEGNCKKTYSFLHARTSIQELLEHLVSIIT